MIDVISTIKEHNMLNCGDVALVCVSGGADSLALLYSIAEIKDSLGLKAIVACHVNHGLRPDEDEDELHLVERHCEKLGVKLHSYSLDMLSKESPLGMSLEEWARELRYECFNDAAKQYTAKILTAHNRNDNNETVIMNIIRGAGLRGASGIPYSRGNIIRPFLDTPREEIERYCVDSGIDFATDSSNLTDDYTRNIIRHRIMPVLSGINSNAEANIASFANIASSTNSFLDREAMKLIRSSKRGEGYDCSILCGAEQVIFDAAVMILIREHNCNQKLLRLVSSVIRGESSATTLNSELVAVRENGFFAIKKTLLPVSYDEIVGANVGTTRLLSEKTVDICEYFDNKEQFTKKNPNLELKNAADYDKIVGNTIFKPRGENMTFTSAARGNTKTLKKVLNELGVNPTERAVYPVAYDDNGIVWIAGEGVHARVAVDSNTKKIWYFSEGTMHNDVKEILISEEEIKSKIAEMGKQISKDFKDKNLTMVSVLKGAVVFVSDLMRALDIHTEIDFMAVSSFKGGVVSSGAVKIVKDLDISLEGRDILIVEDILDSGKTLEYIQEILWSRHPASLKIATLLDKPSRRQSSVIADYVGFVIPDEFVIGYGLDYAEKYRNLPYIGILKPSVYTKSDAEILGV